jgi:hypothetical protein
MKMIDMEFSAACDHAVNKLIEAETLVIDQAGALGFPTYMVLIPHVMPLFVWVKPQNITIPGWQAGKEVVQAKIEAVGAAWRDIATDEDLADVLNLIAIARQTPPRDLPNSSASEEGFSASDAPESKPEVPASNGRSDSRSASEPTVSSWLD